MYIHEVDVQEKGRIVASGVVAEPFLYLRGHRCPFVFPVNKMSESLLEAAFLPQEWIGDEPGGLIAVYLEDLA